MNNYEIATSAHFPQLCGHYFLMVSKEILMKQGANYH
jgi:hypothetical protein